MLESTESVSIDPIWTGIFAPREDEELHERGAKLFRNWVVRSDIISREEAAPDDDAGGATTDDVWRGSLEAFSPDPVTWVKRDLDYFTSRRGDVIPIEEVASDGSFNHLHHL